MWYEYTEISPDGKFHLRNWSLDICLWLTVSEGTPTRTSSYSREEHLSEENVTTGLVNICETLQRRSFM